MNSEEVFSQENWKELFSYAFSLTGNHHDAEDIVQSAVEICIKNDQLPGKVKKPIAYTKGIVRILTKQHNRIITKQSYVDLERIANPNADPLALLIANEKSAFRKRAVERIKEKIADDAKMEGAKGEQGRVLQALMERFRQPEVASLFDISIGTVKSYKHRGIKKLRKLSEAANYISYRNS